MVVLLIFSDYCKPSIRLSALMDTTSNLCDDTRFNWIRRRLPTHKPIEQLEGFRAIPNLNVFRPADRYETIECWELALKIKKLHQFYH